MNHNKALALNFLNHFKNGHVGFFPDSNEWYVIEPLEKQKEYGTTPRIDYLLHFWNVVSQVSKSSPFYPTNQNEEFGDVGGYFDRMILLVNNDDFTSEDLSEYLCHLRLYIDTISLLQKHKNEWNDHQEKVRLISRCSRKEI